MLSFVKNRKGGNNLWDSIGYLYRVSKVVMPKDRSYWNCVARKSDACQRYRNQSEQQGEPRHINRLVERKVKEVETKNISAAALLPKVTPRTVLGVISENLRPPCLVHQPVFLTGMLSTKAVHEKRKLLKGYPLKAKIFEDLLDIPDKFSKTADGKPFLS
jgi:hypothetical protein